MKKFACVILLAASLSGSSYLLADSEPYSSIKPVSYEPFFFENGWILLNKVNTQSTTVFIDVESPTGEAARYIAPNTNETVKVYSINAWNENDHKFHSFLSNVIHENLQDRIIPIRMNAKESSQALNLVSELIFIDSHDVTTLKEKIFSWGTHLSENGVIAGNKWEWPEVEQTVIGASIELGLALSIDTNFWFLKKN